MPAASALRNQQDRRQGAIVPLGRPLEPFADRGLGRGSKLAHRLPDGFSAILPFVIVEMRSGKAQRQSPLPRLGLTYSHIRI
jgi:hypothetical protein